MVGWLDGQCDWRAHGESLFVLILTCHRLRDIEKWNHLKGRPCKNSDCQLIQTDHPLHSNMIWIASSHANAASTAVNMMTFLIDD